MAMKFYSDIQLIYHKEAPQQNDNSHTEKEELLLSNLYPLAGGIPYYNSTAYNSEAKTFELNKATAIGRYYCNTNHQITKLLSGGFTFLEGNCIFELIINERVGTSNQNDPIPPDGGLYGYYIQTLRIHSQIITIDNTNVDECLIEYKRHFETIKRPNGTTEYKFGNWNVCYTPTVTNHKVGLPNLCLSSFNNGNTEIGEALTKLGFKQGNITTTSGQYCGNIAKLGKVIYGAIYNPDISSPIRLSYFASTIYTINLTIPSGFYSNTTETYSKIPLLQYTGANTAGTSYIFGDCTISGSTISIGTSGQVFAPALTTDIKHYFWYVLDDDFDPIS